MTAKKMSRALVTKRAIVQRINRALAREGQKLIARRGKWRSELGDFYIVDVIRNAITNEYVDLEDCGRGLKVLAEWEQLEVEG